MKLMSAHPRLLCTVAAVGLAAGLMASAAGPAAAAASCPTVNPTTGAVSPPPSPGVDWAGCDLAGGDLASANLTSAELDDANLDGADLASATLTSANLAVAKLYTADLADADLSSANLDDALVTHADMVSANLSGISFPEGYLEEDNLSGANLSSADLGTPNVSGLTLTGADLSGTSFTYNADLSGVVSGGITGVPASLPIYDNAYELAGGYLLGPGAVLTDATLAGLDLPGVLLDNADLAGADLAGANLDQAQFGGSTLSGTQLAAANLDGVESGGITGTPASLPANWQLRSGFLLGPDVDLINASLAGDNLSDLDLAGAYTYYANLSNADVDDTNLAGATLDTGTNLTGATFVGADLDDVTWNDVICPDGTNSDKYIDGCFSQLDTTPPVTSIVATSAGVTSVVKPGEVFALNSVPAIGCQTTDKYSQVTVPAKLTVTARSEHGLGKFTARCGGAEDLAGLIAAPVSVTYDVAYGFSGFQTPRAGSTLARSSADIYIVFGLIGADGRGISTRIGRALARKHDVRVTLSGPGVARVSARCSWHPSGGGYFRCVLRTPHGVRTKRSDRYTLTAQENDWYGFVTAPGEPTAANPIHIRFG
jgi:uncharacterized protein YjbI with pentapeptide repeats